MRQYVVNMQRRKRQWIKFIFLAHLDQDEGKNLNGLPSYLVFYNSDVFIQPGTRQGSWRFELM